MASDYFLNIDGIKGESPDGKHKDEIDIDSWSWGESQVGASTGGGFGHGKVAMQEFNFTMKTNKASPALFLNCATGSHITKALLSCRKAGGTQVDYLKVYFTDLIVSKYQTAGSADPEVGTTDQFAFNFSSIKFEYAPQDAKGLLGSPVIFGYNIKENKKL